MVGEGCMTVGAEVLRKEWFGGIQAVRADRDPGDTLKRPGTDAALVREQNRKKAMRDLISERDECFRRAYASTREGSPPGTAITGVCGRPMTSTPSF